MPQRLPSLFHQTVWKAPGHTWYVCLSANRTLNSNLYGDAIWYSGVFFSNIGILFDVEGFVGFLRSLSHHCKVAIAGTKISSALKTLLWDCMGQRVDCFDLMIKTQEMVKPQINLLGRGLEGFVCGFVCVWVYVCSNLTLSPHDYFALYSLDMMCVWTGIVSYDGTTTCIKALQCYTIPANPPIVWSYKFVCFSMYEWSYFPLLFFLFFPTIKCYSFVKSTTA